MFKKPQHYTLNILSLTRYAIISSECTPLHAGTFRFIRRHHRHRTPSVYPYPKIMTWLALMTLASITPRPSVGGARCSSWLFASSQRWKRSLQISIPSTPSSTSALKSVVAHLTIDNSSVSIYQKATAAWPFPRRPRWDTPARYWPRPFHPRLLSSVQFHLIDRTSPLTTVPCWKLREILSGDCTNSPTLLSRQRSSACRIVGCSTVDCRRPSTFSSIGWVPIFS